jgi:hydrogenase maturation protease
MTDQLRAIADAVLYEGYVLWPYRRSALKNQRRWTFGGVFPPGHAAHHPDDRCRVQAQVLAVGDGAVDVRARFLHVVRRQAERDGVAVAELAAGGERWLSWDEAVERELAPGPFSIAGGEEREPAGDGELVRTWEPLTGALEVAREPAGDGLTRLTVALRNTTPWDADDREAALRRTCCSAHVVLRGGPFLSLADPPDAHRAAAEACVQEGLWPALVDDDAVLAAPLILEDRPRIAPESPGDLFDGGEIDQLLTLSILALTEEEKAEMRDADPRTREILERSEALTPEQLMRLHGTVR